MAVKAFDLFFFGRPMLLIPVWTVYLHYLAMCSGSGYLIFDPGRTGWAHLTALTPVFMGIYVFNQIFDIESDRINNKLFFLPQKIISIGAAWVYYAALTLAGAGIILVLAPRSMVPMVCIIALGVMYSVRGVRLKDSPFGGLAANAVAYGILIPWMVALRCAGHAPGAAAVPYFLAIATGYILTTIPDQDGDLAAGKRTLAVILGPAATLWLGLLTSATAAVISVAVGNYEMAVVAAVTTVGIVFLLVRFRYRVMMLACKVPILLLTLLAGAHYPAYLVVLLLTILLTRVYYKRRFNMVYPELG